MPELANPTLWRSGKPYRNQGYVYLWQPPRIFEGRLNLASATYPLTTLPFDGVTTGAYTDIEPGMTLLLGSAAGKDDYGRQRVSDVATSTHIPIGRSSKGTHVGELLAVDNAYITILDLAEVWAKIPFINASGVSSKDGKSFSASIAQPPIANGGTAVIGFVNEDDELVTSFTGIKSHIVDQTASSLTYAYDFKDGTPSTSTSRDTADITFPPGQRYVKLTVNDGTRSHTTKIPVVALQKTGDFAPVKATVTGRRLTPEGQTINFEVQSGDLPFDTYPFGTLIIYFEDEWYGATKGNLVGEGGRGNVKFVGWLTSEVNASEATAKGMSYTLTLNAVDVAGKLAKLPGFGQRVQNKPSPTIWQQMANANIDRYLHHLLYWHSTALEVAPFTVSGLGATYPFMDLGSDGQNLYGQVDERARAIAARLTCNSRGQLQVKQDPQRLPLVERTSTVIIALDERDWSLVKYVYEPQPSVHWLRGSAIIASPTTAKPVFCISPGATPGQGEAEQDTGEQLVTSQFALNVRNGQDYYRLNSKIKYIEITLAHGGDAGIDPAEMEWVTLGVPLTFGGRRGITFASDTRWLVLETNITLDPKKRTVTTSLKLEPEINGIEAETYTPPAPTSIPPSINYQPPGSPYTNLPVDPTIIYPPTPVTPLPTPLVIDASGNMALIATDDGQLILVTNYKQWIVNDIPVNFLTITPPLDDGHLITHANFSGLGIDVYCLTSDSSKSRLWYCANPLVLDFEWTSGDLKDGEYTQIITTDTDGSVYIKGNLTTHTEIDVSASIDEPGVPTGLTFAEGDMISIDATGTWDYGDGSFDADGNPALPDMSFHGAAGAAVGSLIGRIGTTGDWFAVGAGTSLPAPTSGVLYLMIDDEPGEYGDNTGALSVSIDGGIVTSEWNTVFLGSELGRGVNGFGQPYVDIEAALHGDFGGYGVLMSTGDAEQCCTLDNVAILSGSQDLGGIAWWEEGEGPVSNVNDVPPHTNGFISAPGNPINSFRLISTSPISYRVTFTEDCAIGSGGSEGVGFNTLFSDDHGETFGDPVSIGEPDGGADTIKIGDAIYAGAGNILRAATTKGGDYSDYAMTPTDTTADLVLIPRFKPDTTSNNIDTDTPQAVIGSSVLSGDNEALWIEDGDTFTDITPVISGVYGTVVSRHCVIVPWRSGVKMAAIMDFGGTRHLVTRASGAWTDRTAISNDAHYIRMRKGDKNLRELYIANGALAVYSPTFGVDLYSKNIPITGNIISLEVYG